MHRARVASHAGERSRRSGRAAHQGSDLVEPHVEHVVQNEGKSLGWRQRVEYDLQRKADRVGHEHFVLRVELDGAHNDRLGQMHTRGVLGPRLPRLQGVQTHACHDGREPPAEVDPVGSRAADAQPCIPNGLIGFREGAQHPIGHRPEVPAMFLEVFDKPVPFVHGRSWFPSL